MVFCYLVALVMVIAGIVFFTGNAAKYIKGYQETDEKEKKNINIKALCKNVSVLFFVMAAIFIVAGSWEVFRQEYLRLAMVAWMALVCADVLYINKSNRYLKKKPAAKKRR